MSHVRSTSTPSWRTLSGVLLAGALGLFRPATGAEDCFVRGDVNGDGEVNVSDAVNILNSLYLKHECAEAPGDVNDNGSVTIADSLYILTWHYLGKLAAPPAPFPECGADPTVGTGGFGGPNPDYGILAAAPVQLGTRISYQLQYRSVASLLGMSFAFEIAPGPVLVNAELEAVFDEPAVGVNHVPATAFRNEAVIILAVQTTPGKELLPSTEWEWKPLGVLSFDFEEVTDPSLIRWTPEVELEGGCVYRATMVNGLDAMDPVTDHQPTFIQETEPWGFRRGSTGVSGILSYLWSEGTAPVDCTGAPDLDAADANDNEVVTLADALKLRAHLAGRGELESPELCGNDPTDDRRGFDRVDTAYRMTAGKVVSITPAGGRVAEVHVPIKADLPVAITGAQMILEYDTRSLIPFTPEEGDAFSGITGKALVRIVEEGHRGIVIIGLYQEDDGRTLRGAAPGLFVQLGTLHFHLKDSAVFRPMLWIDEVQVGGRRYHSTLVDEEFNDHRPQLLVGEYRFVRGNSNGDALVDISDAVFTNAFLFQAGEVPNCLDAADANNDGTLDISDSIYTLHALFTGGAAIPEPYPQCGLDTRSIDLLDCNPPGVDDACH